MSPIAQHSGNVLRKLQSVFLLIKNLRKKGTALNSLVFSPNGKFLAGGGDDRKVTIWESNGWKEKETLKDPDLTVTALA
ncbi:MAG: WD40 repeat domain-containing protein, partial [Pyrinomonadaceae bacterium]